MTKLGGVGTSSHHCKEGRGEEPLGGGFGDSSHDCSLLCDLMKSRAFSKLIGLGLNALYE